MNYFTPELIVAYGCDDDTIWQDAEKRWEAASAGYNAYLGSIKGELCPGLRRIEENYRLHDATIRGMGQRDGRFVILLHLDTPPQPLLTFAYDLVEGPTIVQDVLPPDYRCSGEQVDWQYDEIEKVEGEPATWRQSILFSNGWEVTLHFHDVEVEEVQALLPPPRNGVVARVTAGLPQSA